MWEMVIRSTSPHFAISYQMKLTITIPIPIAVNYRLSVFAQKGDRRSRLTIISPNSPVLNTHPFPRAVNHALSSPLGNMYIANSPRLFFSSIRSANPPSSPPTPYEYLEPKNASMICGISTFFWEDNRAYT